MFGGTFAPPRASKTTAGVHARNLALTEKKHEAEREAERLAVIAEEAERNEFIGISHKPEGGDLEAKMALHVDAMTELCGSMQQPFYAGLKVLMIQYALTQGMRVGRPVAGRDARALHIYRQSQTPAEPDGDSPEFRSSGSISRSMGSTDTVIQTPVPGDGSGSLPIEDTKPPEGLLRSHSNLREAFRRRGKHLSISFSAPKRTKIDQTRLYIWRFLEQPDGSRSNHIFHGCWNFMISVSVVSAIASDLELSPGVRRSLPLINITCTSLFTAEFLVKLVVSGPQRRVYLKSAYTMVDIIVIVQGYISFVWLSVHPVLTLLKTQAPILRLLKIARTSPKWRLLIISMKRCVEPLLIPLYLMVLLVTFCGSLLYWVETNFPDCVVERRGEGCKDGLEKTPAFLSIPHAMWFVVVTIATVGYGDVYPKSDGGKVINALLIVAGVGYLAMPLAIIGNQFGEVWKDRKVLLVLDKIKTNMGGKVDMDKVKAIFAVHDDGSGTGEITFDQFELIVETLDAGLNKRDTKDIFDAIDEDESGLISLEEFTHKLQTIELQ